MKRTNRCPKCDSTRVIADATALDRSGDDPTRDFTVATYRNPDAWVFRGEQRSTVSVWACGDCGYLEFYADAPRDLLVGEDGQSQVASRSSRRGEPVHGRFHLA